MRLQVCFQILPTGVRRLPSAAHGNMADSCYADCRRRLLLCALVVAALGMPALDIAAVPIILVLWVMLTLWTLCPFGFAFIENNVSFVVYRTIPVPNKIVLKSLVLPLLKFLLIVGIFAYLFRCAIRDAAFEKLLTQPKHWDMLGLAFAFYLFAVVITIIRWRWLVLSLDIPLSYWNAFRLGFLGLLFNLSPMGIVGGDGVKAFLLAKANPTKQADSVATVFVDRIVGLLVMFLYGSATAVISGFAFREEWRARSAAYIIFLFTAIGFVGVGCVFLPFFAKGHVERLIEKIPYIGKTLSRLTQSLLVFRNKKECLFWSFIVTFLVHSSLGVSLYCVAKGLYSDVPSIFDHQVLFPIANLTTMIPLAAGPFEMVLDRLYPLFMSKNGELMGIGIGLVVALGFRIISIAVTLLGIVFYFSSRKELTQISEEKQSPPY